MADALGLQNKRAIIVGGGQGMGRESVLALARAGAHVAIVDAEIERANAVAAEVQQLDNFQGQAVALAGDVTNAGQASNIVDQANQQLGGLDILVNIVGAASWAPLVDMDEATWEQDFALNLKQHWYVARSATRHWIDSGDPGVVCTVASVSGLFSSANHAAYGAAKAALLSFVKSAAQEWWPHKVRINAVVPGAVRTPRIEAGWADGSVPKPDADTYDRMALPVDIANAILFMVSGMARMITGQSLVVDGGSTSKFPYTPG